MGEVYRATDTQLKRDVAIKLLPEAFTQDPDRLARFEREAQLLAQLHHPNIASIFGIEETDGGTALVMELVEGPTLGERMDQSRLPLETTLGIALQIAEALEEAHAKGIVHRDLKPANVKLTTDGRVKVLDFGLAKALDPAANAAGTAQQGTMANSPTLTSAGTQLGVILGTASYMSPEQARGVAIDRRADVWAFGVVLYEMLTGSRLFEGETVSDVLAGVLKSEIDFDSLPSDTPPSIRRLLRRCLKRKPKNRLHDIADARIVVEEVIAGDDGEPEAAPVAQARRGTLATILPWLVAGSALVALAIALTALLSDGDAKSPDGYALSLSPPAGGQFLIGSNSGWGAISPDGRRIVVRATTPAGTGLWVRSLDRTEGRFLPGTEEGFYPFWSHDGLWVAFFNRGWLQKIEIAGGLPEKICVAAWGRGGSWSESGKIVLTPIGGGAIHVVDAAGGEARPVTRVDEEAGESAHYWPVWLPDGERFLYFIRSGRREDQGIYLSHVRADGIDEERRRVVASSSSGLLVSAAGAGETPTLLWAQDGTLLARAFDPQSGTVSGPTSRIAEGVRVLDSQRAVMASASNNGALLWADSRFGARRIGSYHRDGRGPELLPETPGSVYQPLISPDGRRASFVVSEGGQADIWMLDRETGAMRALTSTAAYEENVTWSPDSQEIIFSGGVAGEAGYFRSPADGSDSPKRILPRSWQGRLISSTLAWLPGDWLIVEVEEEGGASDILMVQLDDPNELFELVTGPGDQYEARTSPGGGELAYLSDESGRLEAYLVSMSLQDGRPFAGSDRQRIPGEEIVALEWGLEGDELVVITAVGEVLAVAVDRRGGRARVGEAVRLFVLPEAHGSTRIGVGPGGDEFLFVVDPEAEYQTLSVLVDWPARLEE